MKISFRTLMSGIVAAPLAAASAFSTEEPSNRVPPCFVVILADDMGWADLGHDGSRIDTPNLDRLAREGAKLSRFYASAPMCSPTRAALLTGRYPHSVGMPELASSQQRGAVPVLSLSHEAITLPEALKPAGYRSAAVGKWHLGYGLDNAPRTHGFDEYWGSLLGTPQYWEPRETYHNETPIKVTGHFTDAITDFAVAWLRGEAQTARPFFLYLAYNAPHYPLEAPADLVYKYRRRFPGRGLFAIYAAMVEHLDRGIGRVLATLDEFHLTDRTVVVFTSDNGPSAEPNSYGPEGADFSNGPLRGFKFGLHEGGVRVPFLARWPGHIPPGLVRAEPAITMDILPTLLDAAGIVPDAGHEIHGTSILPLLENRPFNRRDAFHWENQQNAAVLAGEWKLLIRPWLKEPLLYRPGDDASESTDLAANNPDKVAELLALHARWRSGYYPNPLPQQTIRSSYFFPATREDP